MEPTPAASTHRHLSRPIRVLLVGQEPGTYPEIWELFPLAVIQVPRWLFPCLEFLVLLANRVEQLHYKSELFPCYHEVR
jgi:hypothetical protein